MSFKSQMGEIVDAMVERESVDLDIYDFQVNSSDFKGEVTVDSDGDLRVSCEIDIIDIEKLFTAQQILDYFTEEDLRSYLEENYGN